MGERKSFLLRVDAELWKELNAWAQQELRSANGQIEYLLREAVKQRKNTGKKSAEDGQGKQKNENQAA